MSLYTGTVRHGWHETVYDVRATSPAEARVLIAARAATDAAAVRGVCRVLADFGGMS